MSDPWTNPRPWSGRWKTKEQYDAHVAKEAEQARIMSTFFAERLPVRGGNEDPIAKNYLVPRLTVGGLAQLLDLLRNRKLPINLTASLHDEGMADTEGIPLVDIRCGRPEGAICIRLETIADE